MIRNLFTTASFAALLAIAACAPPAAVAPAPALGPPQITHTVVDGAVEEDALLAEMVGPYRERLEAEMLEVVATAAFEITKQGRFETPLGNLAADAMLIIAQQTTGETFDLAVGNAGGLRVPISAGPVTRGAVFELMPFDNYVVIQRMDGVQVDSLAQQLARIGGEPVAGISFAVTDEGRAVDLLVGGEPLEANRVYSVVTHNYLAYGGGDMPALWEPIDRRELPLPLRDAFIEYFRQQGTLEPRVEGRIRTAN
jgi:2',3'-cyclic-nucleotide 2'-phosphodiesterase (5'-nucleotidase family)